VLFQGSRYATRLPIGTKASLDAASDAALKRFYRDWYRPDLMAVVAVGDFDGAAVEREIRARFSTLANPPHERPRVAYSVPDHEAPLVAVATDREATNTSIEALWLLPARPTNTVAAYRRGLVETLYNAMLNRRLSELAQRPDPPFIGAGSQIGRLIRAREVYSIGAAVPDTGVLRGLEAVLTEAARVDQFGFTQGELDRARADLLRSYDRAFAEREKTHSSAFVDEYVENFLTGEPTPGIAYETRTAHTLLPALTLADVNAVGRELITERNRVVLVTAPAKAGVRVPDKAALLAAFDRVAHAGVTAWVDSTTNGPLVGETPKAGRIVSEQTTPGVGVTEWRLSNGARVLLKTTDFQADQVLFRAYSPGGSSLVPDNDVIPAMTAASVIANGGVGTFSAITLGKRLAGKAVTVRPTIANDEEGLSGSASPQDIDLLLQLTYLYFTAPRADTSAFTSLLQQARASLADRGASPEVAFGDTLNALLTQHNARVRPFTAERVSEMDLGKSLAIYRDRFADASDFTFVFVGAVSADSLRPLVERYLASLPATGRKEHARDLGIRPPTGVVERTVRRGTEPKAQTAIVFSGPLAAFTRTERLALASLADVLDIQLRETLREQLGGTYGVRVGAQTEREPAPRYSLSIGFGSAPDRVESLTKALFAQLDTLASRGPSAATLAKVKEARLRDRETSLKQNSFWLSQIVAFDHFGWPLADIPHGDTLVNALDARTIQQAARRYLDRKNYVRVVLVPEN
jgi:zinc protease